MQQNWTDRYLWTSDNVRLHYRDYGATREGQPVLLCLPGLTRNARDFEAFAQHFAPRFRVVTPSFRGRGDSGYARDPLTYVPLTYLQDVGRLMDDARISSTVIVGTSLGGLIGLLLDVTQRSRIAGLVLNDLGPDMEEGGLARVRQQVGRGGNWQTWLIAARDIARRQAEQIAARDLEIVQRKSGPALTLQSEGDGVDRGLRAALAIGVGLAVKTPLVPFHTWLPPAHGDAPAAGSAVLAAVLLKMGTYGFVRIAMPILPEAWRAWAWAIVVIGIVSVLYGAFVALAQTNLKRMIAYTSVNHMGYIVLALGAVGLVVDNSAQARSVAVTGAVVQMVSHGLITAALFLLAGVMHTRAGTYDLGSYGGLAKPAPRYATLFAVAAFASLGLPGLSGFIAEFQIFAGSIAVAPVTAIALSGILVTAALFLLALQRVFTGPTQGQSPGFADLHGQELWSIGPLLALSLLIGVLPQVLLGVIEPASAALVDLVGR